MSINYPNPTITNKNNNSLKSQGMIFENALNESNAYYISKDIAIIYKKPTPIRIVKVDYPKRSSAKIVEAYYQTPSTTDYNGIYKGRYIDYEAKETVKNYFPFAHIFEHQINHLVNVDKHGGLAFVIIYFRTFNEVYLIDIKKFYSLYLNKERKSITIESVRELGTLSPLGYTPLIDYLKAVDKLYNL